MILRLPDFIVHSKIYVNQKVKSYLIINLIIHILKENFFTKTLESLAVKNKSYNKTKNNNIYTHY